MRLLVLSLVLFSAVTVLPTDSFARRAIYRIDSTSPDDKTLGNSDNHPDWTAENVKMFCEWRKKTVRQNEKKCVESHQNKIGHKMTLGELQELKNFQNAAVERSDKKAEKESQRPKGKAISTIVQPPLPD